MKTSSPSISFSVQQQRSNNETNSNTPNTPTTSETRVLMHSSAPESESRNEMRLSDETAGKLSADEVAIIFSFLPRVDIMYLRRVCTTWRDAAKKTLVRLTKFVVDDPDQYNAMRAMSTALPNLQHLSIWNLYQSGHKYNDGEDRDERRAAETVNFTAHDINIISRFRKLRSMKIWEAPLNGRYPVLFDFPVLQKLTIYDCSYLKWDLEMLEGLPSLKELDCLDNLHLTGSLNSLRVLKDTLEKLQIINCSVEGNFMDLADFPRLKALDLRCSTNVRGDIRDIGENHFPALEYLSLPKGVHGGYGYTFQNVSDVHEFVYTIHLLLQRTQDLFEDEHDSLSEGFYWSLSADSPDWYDWEIGCPKPPFRIHFFQAGSRRGWSWCNEDVFHSCEINWLDPEPNSDSSDYEAYIEQFQLIEQRLGFYRGYDQPPTEEEYRRLCDGLLP